MLGGADLPNCSTNEMPSRKCSDCDALLCSCKPESRLEFSPSKLATLFWSVGLFSFRNRLLSTEERHCGRTYSLSMMHSLNLLFSSRTSCIAYMVRTTEVQQLLTCLAGSFMRPDYDKHSCHLSMCYQIQTLNQFCAFKKPLIHWQLQPQEDLKWPCHEQSTWQCIRRPKVREE